MTLKTATLAEAKPIGDYDLRVKVLAGASPHVSLFSARVPVAEQLADLNAQLADLGCDPLSAEDAASITSAFTGAIAQGLIRSRPLDPPLGAKPYREARAAAYRDELGVDKGDFVKTIGDVLDTLIAEIATLRAAQPTTAAFSSMITKIQAVKARFPKE